VVDDFARWRNYLVAKLSENPVLRIVGLASDGLEAVRQAAELQPDLILMDVNLPNVSGIAAARRIRELSLASKILFVSQDLDLDVVRASLDAGGLGYVAKSGVESELLTAVDAVMSARIFVTSQLARHDFTGVISARNGGTLASRARITNLYRYLCFNTCKVERASSIALRSSRVTRAPDEIRA
jgi:DNA-binding NarL/FixJ family response regulator